MSSKTGLSTTFNSPYSKNSSGEEKNMNISSYKSSPIFSQDSLPSNTTCTVVISSDGGHRPKASSFGFCIYNIPTWRILSIGGSLIDPMYTSQDCEFLGVVAGIRHAITAIGNCKMVILVDNQNVEKSILGSYQSSKPLHRTCVRIVQACQYALDKPIAIFQVPRAYNKAADFVCNSLMDKRDLVNVFSNLDVFTKSTMDYFNLNIRNLTQLDLPIIHEIFRSKMDLVLQELVVRFALRKFNVLSTGRPPRLGKTSAVTHASTPNNFGPCLAKPPKIENHAMKLLPSFNLPSGTSEIECMMEDSKYLSEICVSMGGDVAKIIELFRSQSAIDYRPNKMLSSARYRRYLPFYPDLEAICEIADSGFTPRAPPRDGARPLMKNYASAIERAPAFHKRLASEFYKGRTLILDSKVATNDCRVGTSPYSMAPKKGIDFNFDGRIIHDLSAPGGRSVNASVPLDKLDASTDSYIDLGIRILQCYLEFPGAPILCMTADIDSAFHNVPASAKGSLIFGGRIPDSTLIAIALTAVFGYRDSSGLFALFARAMIHYHGSGSSYVLNILVRYWNWLWVDDVVLVEPNLGNRLRESEQRLRDSIVLVFGKIAWNDSKFDTWCTNPHAVGLNWDLDVGTLSMPVEKISKALSKVIEIIALLDLEKYPSIHTWKSLVGSLRHVSTCVPSARGFFQNLVAVDIALQHKRQINWAPIRLDLGWFEFILSTHKFNGISLNVFTSTCHRNSSFYVGWDSKSSLFIDFEAGFSLISTCGGPSGAAALLQWYLISFKLVPGSFGPHDRHPTAWHVHCQTSDFSRRLRNWYIGSVSLRVLAYIVAEQNIVLFTHSPTRIANISILSNITNSIVSSQGPEMPNNNPLLPILPANYKTSVTAGFKKLQERPTIRNWQVGTSFVACQGITSPQFIVGSLKNKTIYSHSLQRTVRKEAKIDHPLDTTLSTTLEWLQSRACISTLFKLNSSSELGFKWHARASKGPPQQPARSRNHQLVPPFFDLWGPICFLRGRDQSAKSRLAVASCLSLDYCDRVKYSTPATPSTS
jgi:ribonuclease HI